MLAGTRIIDVAHHYGQYCGKLLADLGADVIKIEPPGGDPARAIGPFADDQTSLFFAYYNCGKRGLTLDPLTPSDRAIFERLLATADAIIETPAHGNAGGMQLEFEALQRQNPGLILTSIVGFVGAGPYRDYRSTSQVMFALSGIMKSVGPPDGPPEAPPGQMGFDLTAVDAATGVVCALLARAHSGRGQHVTVAAHEVLASEINPRPPQQFDDTRHPGAANPQLAPTGTYDCLDGSVVMFVNLPAHWKGLKELLGNPPGIQGPEWDDRSYREVHAAYLSDLVRSAFASRSMADIVEEGQRLHVPCGPVNTISTFAADPHLAERGFLVVTGGWTMPGAPYKLSDSGWAIQRPAPRLGQHTAEILAELGLRGRRRRPGANLMSHPRPLAGIRVVALTTAFAGPTVARYLADLGAEVIKVESRRRWDNTRHASSAGVGGMTEPGGAPTAPGFGYFNRNQLGAAIDLSQPKGRELMLRLIGISDVVVENFSRQVLHRWGFAYDQLTQVKPNIILLDMQGFGQTGRLKDYISFGSIINSFAGLSTLWGVGGHGFFVDYVVAQHAVLAVVSAMYRRGRTGHGAHIDMAQLEAAGALLGVQCLDYFANGVVQRRKDGRLLTDAPSGCYRCNGEDAWCVIEVRNDDDWRRLRQALSSPLWAQEQRFAASAGRLAARVELDQHLAAWTRERSAGAVQSLLQSAGVPAAAVLAARDVFDDPQLQETGFYWNIDHPALGVWPYPRLTIHLSDAPEPNRRAGPLLGEHNEYVFGQLLGLSTEELGQLAADGVLS